MGIRNYLQKQTTELMKFIQVCTLGLMATAASAQESAGLEEQGRELRGMGRRDLNRWIFENMNGADIDQRTLIRMLRKQLEGFHGGMQQRRSRKPNNYYRRQKPSLFNRRRWQPE